MNNWYGFPTPIRDELPIEKDYNTPEAESDCPYAYNYDIGMILYLVSNIRLYISFAVHWCDQFTHNIKEQHDNSVKSICMHLQDTKYKGLVLNPIIIMMLDCYVNTYFERL